MTELVTESSIWSTLLAKLMVDGDFYESYLPTKDMDEIRTLERYRKSLGEENTMIKN